MRLRRVLLGTLRHLATWLTPVVHRSAATVQIPPEARLLTTR